MQFSGTCRQNSSCGLNSFDSVTNIRQNLCQALLTRLKSKLKEFVFKICLKVARLWIFKKRMRALIKKWGTIKRWHITVEKRIYINIYIAKLGYHF